MLSRLIRFYVYSNLHISLCAALYVASAFLLVDVDIDYGYVLFIFTGTFIIYNLHRWISNTRITTTDRAQRHAIIDNKKGIIIGLSVACGLIGLLSFLILDSSFQQYLLIPTIISALYILPVYKGFRIRDIHFVKILLIAITWSCFYCIPLWIHSSDYIVPIGISQILFFLAITIPFDIRDSAVDDNQGLMTIANTIKENQAINLALLFLLVSLHTAINLSLSMAWIILIAVFYSISAVFIYLSLGKREFYHLAYLDGLIGLQGFVIITYCIYFSH